MPNIVTLIIASLPVALLGRPKQYEFTITCTYRYVVAKLTKCPMRGARMTLASSKWWCVYRRGSFLYGVILLILSI